MVHVYSNEQGELEPRRPQMGHEKCHEKVYDKRPFYRPHNWPLVTERRTQGTLYSRWISGRELVRFYDTHLSLVFTSPKNLPTRDESRSSSHRKETRPFVVWEIFPCTNSTVNSMMNFAIEFPSRVEIRWKEMTERQGFTINSAPLSLFLTAYFSIDSGIGGSYKTL